MAYLDAYLIWGISVVAVLALIFIVFMWRNRMKRGFSEENAVQTLGISLVILGIIFGEDRLIGYSFIGAGVLLSIASLFMKKRGAEPVR